MAAPKVFSKYGYDWPNGTDPLVIEFYMLRKPDDWLKKQGRSLFFHMKQAMSLLWRQDFHNRWTDLILRTSCENDITVLVGCADSGKTYTMSKIALLDYWCYPEKTLALISTTEGRGSELRIWGVIKDLFNEAKINYPELAGKPLDYLKTITTDAIDEKGELARSLRRGLVVVPCKTGGLVSGLAPYIGIKAERLRHYGDEVAVMVDSFLNAYSNWYGKDNFKGMMSGNFMEMDDPLGVASEPVDGWDSFVDTGKTQTWRSRFFNAMVVALDGRDSPNFDFPDHLTRVHYKNFIGHKKLDAVLKTHGEDSWQWHSQCVGKPTKGMDIWRVFTRSFCQQHKAQEDVIWANDDLLLLYALDPAYGGGDRCVGRVLTLGKDISGKQILSFGETEIIPVSPRSSMEPEDQIAGYIKNRLDTLGIDPKNCFYDSFGRGTLGFSFAKLFGINCPIPVNSGSTPTTRPVRFDLFKEEKDGRKRLKRCDEHYIKFITEMWFSVHEAVETEQIRNLDRETIAEFCSRKFRRDEGNDKLELETKDDMKTRTGGKSPDLADCSSVGVEGARQRGFRIENLSLKSPPTNKPDWLDKFATGYQELIKSGQLQND